MAEHLPATREDVENLLAAREAHQRLVREIAAADAQVASLQARRRTLLMKLLEVERLLRGAHAPTRTERTLTDERKVLAALPGGVSVLSSRTGIDKKRIQQLVSRMRDEGRVRREGYVWHEAHWGDDDDAA